jgi:hypothetical protein
MALTIPHRLGKSILDRITNSSLDPVGTLFKLSFSFHPAIRDIEFHPPTRIHPTDSEAGAQWEAVLTATLIPFPDLDKKGKIPFKHTMRVTASTDADATSTAAGAMLEFMWIQKLLNRYYNSRLAIHARKGWC